AGKFTASLKTPWHTLRLPAITRRHCGNGFSHDSLNPAEAAPAIALNPHGSAGVPIESITNLLDAKGCPLDKQRFTWKELVGNPISKLDDDAFTRLRIILMNVIETDVLRFEHIAQRFNKTLRVPLAKVRRIEQMQATMVNWLIGADHSPIETTIGYEQVAIEVAAAVAQTEPDAYQAQT